MKRSAMDFHALPETPGVYLFRGSRNNILYVGRATDLRSRVRSYFSDRLVLDRGERLAEALEKTKRIEVISADSVLEAYILEANLIKRHEPMYNVVDKDNKSFQFVGITKELFPRVLVVRGRNMEQGIPGTTFSHVFGPFPRGAMLKEALRVLRKILPYRDVCTPYDPDAVRKGGRKPRMCFRAELGLCPGVCAGLLSSKEYAKRIRELVLFFSGKKKQLLAVLERDMKRYARAREFEKAEEVRRRMFSLTHIQDVALIKRDVSESEQVSTSLFRVEAYDVAHLAGEHTIGVMVVFNDGTSVPSAYRTFTIRDAAPGDDVGALREVLVRRFKHAEWRFPNLVVVDGGKAQIAAAEAVLRANGLAIPVVSVVKTEKHTPRAVLGAAEYVHAREREIVQANAEAHRFALAKHRRKRSDMLLR